MSNLRLVFGDQLNKEISALKGLSKSDFIFMCEVKEEATHIKHHKKKIVLLFSAMRHFAEELKKDGYNVIYSKLEDGNNTQSFDKEIDRVINTNKVSKLILTEPSEYRVLEKCLLWKSKLNIPVEIREDTRFLASHTDFEVWSKDKKQLRMEFFYRKMRVKHNILMNNEQPEGGKWNYDAENRKPPIKGLNIPAPTTFKADNITKEVINLVKNEFNTHYGSIESFNLAVTRSDALKVLEKFIKIRLEKFGDYQDAMIENEPWMYHSHISFYLNCGLLLPLECILEAEKAYKKGAPLNAVEGFIRQILGWREYIRGIYWLQMPQYEEMNALNASKKLPDFFWNNNTNLNCLNQCFSETYENAYAHHIQRLMVIGNFSLLCGLNPKEVNEWYHIVYADAYQWVELPNVSGMVLFADDGVVASKPYAAGGSYINKMSNYCKNCKYSVKEKTGDSACPFNYLYWNFLIQHQEKFKSNPRMAMIYRTLQKMDEDKVEEIKNSSIKFLNSI